MPAKDHSLIERLCRAHEVTIRVIGRKSGRTISNPVWFTFDHGTLYLLPVNGSLTQWYRNVLENPRIGVSDGRASAEGKAAPVTDPGEVKSVVEKFRGKYGPGDVKKYYTRFDVAVAVQMD